MLGYLGLWVKMAGRGVRLVFLGVRCVFRGSDGVLEGCDWVKGGGPKTDHTEQKKDDSSAWMTVGEFEARGVHNLAHQSTGGRC